MLSALRTGSSPERHPLLGATLLASWLIQSSVPGMGHAQALPPITSSGLNTTVTKNGNVYDITGGTRPGSGPNLFHSFGEFGVPTGNIANFLNETALPTSNILGRVTGGNPSNIFGTIQTTGFGSANLLLMNPAGIVFGPNASLNVGGSVSFTTADYLRFADGAQFHALPGPQDAAISSAPIAAFGFLGSNSAAIAVQGGQLAVAEGHSISLAGGNIEITGGTLPNGTAQPARLAAPGGQINLVAVGSAGEVLTTGTVAPPTDPTLNGFTTLRNISLAQGSTVTTSAPTAGRIVIRSGQFTMDGSRLEASATAIAPNTAPSASTAGGISVQADHVTLSHGSNVLTSAIDGTAGDISFEVSTLRSNVGADGRPLLGAAPVTIASTSTGQGGAGSISITGQAGGPADAVLLSNTHIVTGVTNAADPTVAPGDIVITAQQVELSNGTVLRSDTTGGADAGAITLNVNTLTTQEGPDGRVLFSSDSNCGSQCFGGQAGDITIQGLHDAEHSVTRNYSFIFTPQLGRTDPLTLYFARRIDMQGTDLHSQATSNAPGGKVIMRGQEQVSLTDTSISVATQDFYLDGTKPNGQPARYQGLSNIDIMSSDIVLNDSTIKADALVSDIGTCPTCQGGPTAGEIWLRADHSVTANNSFITNTSRGRAQAGLTKIIGDNYFTEGAIWDTLYPDRPTGTVRLINSEVTVEALHSGLPGYLRIRADKVMLNHSILNSSANDVSNVRDSAGQLFDVVGAGERGPVSTDGRDVQGSTLISAKILDITGGGIVAPTQGSRIASRIQLQTDELITRPGTGPGGTLAAPKILNPDDPTRVVISSSSTGSGGAGMISISGLRPPARGDTPLPPGASIRLSGTDLLTNTNIDALGGKILLKVRGPVELHDSTISANVTDVRPQSINLQEQGGNIDVSAGSLSIQGGGVSALSRGTQNGGNIIVTVQGPISVSDGATISASNTGSADAGNIVIHAGNQFLSQNGSVTTQSSQASGGNITIQAVESIRLVNSQLNTSVQGGPTTAGGNIMIDPEVVTLQNSQILAQAVQGQGGNISIVAGTFLADQSSVVSASSQLGLSGTVTIQSPLSSLSGTLATLPQQPLHVHNLLRQRCAAQAYGRLSSLVIAGRDTLPIEPGGWLLSPMAFMPHEVVAQEAEPVTGYSHEISEQGPAEQVSSSRLGFSSQRGASDWTMGCKS
ncbi:MAG: filamentous hemagglutinin N-terminal domain-containing protein [Nitrospira sp.]|nr:filamentous hemagglutinin N-terminal domain-containing protein [Nitrospira sp.]